MPSINNDLTTDVLLALQPDYYNTSDVMKNIDNANATELNNCNHKVTTVYNNLYLDTCDDSMLTRWEKILNLDNDSNENTAYRLSKIHSRLKGQGTFTIPLLQNVANSFHDGDIEVIEHNEDYYFTIKFVSEHGYPPNLDDFKAVVEELKPAHLGVEYEFTYLSWAEYEGYNKTAGQWDSLNLTCEQFEKYKV